MQLKRLNIVFSTTRQFNPGDEMILKGVLNLFRHAGIDCNPIIYNRHPDIRPHQAIPYPYRDANGRIAYIHPPYSQEALHDNSIHSAVAWSAVDLVVFAGSPDYFSLNLIDLYVRIVENNIPVLYLGIGGSASFLPVVEAVMKKAGILAVRDEQTLAALALRGFHAEYLPCPALLSADESLVKRITQCRTIGLIYQCSEGEGTEWNVCTNDMYAYMLPLYRRILSEYSDAGIEFVLLCHHAEELAYAKRDFPDAPILYSYDSADYLSLYSRCDLVIGPRIHGIGMAASMGIPGIALTYDGRGSTCRGFLAELCDDKTPEDAFMDKIDSIMDEISERNRLLIEHRQNSEARYVKMLRAKLDLCHVRYEYKLSPLRCWYDYVKLSGICGVNFDEALIDRLMERLIKELQGKRIALKGAGRHTGHLLDYIGGRCNIICILDKNPEIHDFRGFRVVRDAELLREDVDTIIISSFYFRDEMLADIERIDVAADIIDIYYQFFSWGVFLTRPFYEFRDDLNK